MKKRILASSSKAQKVLQLVEGLQQGFADQLSTLDSSTPSSFELKEWLRHEGEFGGGHAFAIKQRAAI